MSRKYCSILGSVLSVVFFLSLSASAAPHTPTYNKDIAPILYNNCLECHRQGEPTPFSLESYEDAVRRGKMMLRVTERGLMPPWKAARGFETFENERHIDPEDIETLRAWVLGGTPQGDPDDLPEKPVFPTGWRLGEPDLVITMREPYDVPADGSDIYINFPVAIPPIPEGSFLKAIEFRTTARTTAHHTLFALDTEGISLELDSHEDGYGFRGMAPQLRNSRVGGWAVGNLPLPFPDGVALEVPDGSHLVLEAHFHPTGKAETEQASVGLFLTDEAPTRKMVNLPVPFGFGVGTNIRIPAGEANYEVEESFTIPVDVEAVSIMPHAHYRCREMRATAVLPDGSERVLIHIPDWDFAWQEQYAFKEPVPLPQGTVLKTYFRYDNSAENPRNPVTPPVEVTWGPESTDEMASLAVNVIPVDINNAPVLQAAVEAYRKETHARIDIDLIWPVLEKQMIARFDEDGDGELNLRERMKALSQARNRMQGNPEGRELGQLFLKKLAERFTGSR